MYSSSTRRDCNCAFCVECARHEASHNSHTYGPDSSAAACCDAKPTSTETGCAGSLLQRCCNASLVGLVLLLVLLGGRRARLVAVFLLVFLGGLLLGGGRARLVAVLWLVLLFRL